MSEVAAFAAALISGVQAAEPGIGQPTDWELWHQIPVTTVGAQIVELHALIAFIVTGVVVLVFGLSVYVLWRFNERRNPVPARTSHNTLIEVLWTVLPVLLLLVIAVPSFRLLYYADRATDPEMTLIVHGYQWYWGYELPDQQIAEFQSLPVPDDQLQPGQPRLLATDPPLILPVETDIQLLITGRDVIHSWYVPAFGIKRDAIPGRMNETWIRIDREGVYYGQCFELCGTGHAYMPVEVHAVSRAAFDDWVEQQTAGLDLPEPPELLTRRHPAATGQMLAGDPAPPPASQAPE